MSRRGLTRREAQVVSHLARGETNAQIALSLGLSRRTIEKHLERVFAKLGVSNRTQALMRAWVRAAR